MRFIVLLFGLFISASAAAENLKVGVVIVDRILAEAPQVEAVNAEMLKRFSGRRDELAVMEGDIKKLQEEYQRNELVMTQDKLNEIKDKALAKLQDFKQKEATLTQEVNTMRNQKLAELQETIRTVIKEIAKEDDFDLILSEGVVYASEALDITEMVLGKMKKLHKKAS